MYSVHGNVMLLLFPCCLYNIRKNHTTTTDVKPCKCREKGTNQSSLSFSASKLQMQWRSIELGTVWKTLSSKLLHRSLILLITFWPHLLPSNVASPPPLQKIISTHFAQTSALFRGGEVPVLLIIIQRPLFTPLYSHIPLAKTPKEIHKKSE